MERTCLETLALVCSRKICLENRTTYYGVCGEQILSECWINSTENNCHYLSMGAWAYPMLISENVLPTELVLEESLLAVS